MRTPNKGSLAPANGHEFKHTLFAEMRRLSPGLVTVNADKVKDFWEKLPYAGAAPLGGVEMQINNGRVWDVFYADQHAFPYGLLIEAKTQNTSGTAYEKIAYSLLRASHTSRLYSIQVALVVGGPAFEQGAGLRVVQECREWKQEYGLEGNIFGSLRDFSSWFGRKIRAAQVDALPKNEYKYS